MVGLQIDSPFTINGFIENPICNYSGCNLYLSRGLFFSQLNRGDGFILSTFAATGHIP